jgi:hypothetical protein
MNLHLSQLVSLDVSQCIRLTDACLSRLRLPALEVLNVSRCVSLAGDFLGKRGFGKVHTLLLNECHRIR